MTPGERIATLEAWVKNVGDPMKLDVEANKRALWLVTGGAGVVGVVVGVAAPIIIPIIQAWLKGLGLG